MNSRSKRHIIFLFFTFYAIISVSQATQNPFEIVSRLAEEENMFVESIQTVDTTQEAIVDVNPSLNTPETPIVVLPNSDNPFEVIERPGEEEMALEEENTKTNTINTPSKPNSQPAIKNIEPVGKSTPHRGQFFIIMLLTLIPMTLLFTVFREYFMKAFENVSNAGVLNRSYREFAGASIIPMNLWYIASWLNLGIFLSLIMNYYEAAFTKSPLLNVLICIGIIGGLHLLKHFILAFMAAIFPVKKEAKLYAFLLLLFGILIGVFLVPMNIAIIYAANQTTKLLIFGTLAIIGGLYLVRAYRALLVGGRLLALHKFHFLLYICVVELAPIFILIKLGLIYLGK
ncbi:MAG: DUF4271 domain-containing protein [Bacteroidota bacterium]